MIVKAYIDHLKYLSKTVLVRRMSTDYCFIS